MRTICALAFVALPLAAWAQPSRRVGERICPNTAATKAADADHIARFRRLGDLPPANAVLTVLRTEDGCSTPVIVRYGIGARDSRAQGEPPR